MSGLRILTAAQVDHVLAHINPDTLLRSQEKVFIGYSSARNTLSISSLQPETIQSPLRITLWTKCVKFLFMPARVGGMGGTAAKIVGAPRDSRPLRATTVVLDEETGEMKGVVNAAKLTALRNACGSLLSFRTLDPPPPQNLLIFGSGSQALSHAELFLRTYPTITHCRIVVRKQTSRSEALITTLRSSFPVVDIAPIISSTSDEDTTGLNETVYAANIIITVTSSLLPLFDSSHVQSGTHVILVGSSRPEQHEVDTALIKRTKTILVDSREGCGDEAGELIAAGVQENEMVELGEVLGGDPQWQWQKGDVTVYKSVGMGLQDVAMGRLVLDEAERLLVGTVIADYD